jgi:hypothetical protein
MAPPILGLLAGQYTYLAIEVCGQEAAMATKKRSGLFRPAERPPRRSALVWLRLLLIAVLAVLVFVVLPTPWALHIGGRFTPSGEWDGYGAVQASNGGHYLLFTQLRGGLLAGHGYSGCGLTGCDSLFGSARLCTQGGQDYTFRLGGAVHSWLGTNGARTDISLTGGTPTALPDSWVVAFHGTWHGPELPLANTDGSFTEVFTPAGAIRTVTSRKDAGTAHGVLRYGSAASFDSACRALAAGSH